MFLIHTKTTVRLSRYNSMLYADLLCDVSMVGILNVHAKPEKLGP